MEIIAGLIIGVTFLAIGFFLGNFFPLLKLEDDSEETPEEIAAQAEEMSEAIVEGKAIEIDPEPAIPPRRNLADPVRFWRTAQTKKLMVEFEETLVPFKGDLGNDEHGKLAMILVDLQDWIGLGSRLEKEENGVVEPEETEKEPIRVSYNPINMLRAAVATDGKLPTEETLVSIVSQIDAELQKLLTGSVYEKRGISLLEGPDKALQVKVGLDKFEGIDEVPEEGIREIIRKAISIWEG